jgi:hypothetical protein
MKTYTVKIKGISPYSSSRHYSDEKLPKESAKDYEARTWRNRLHVDESGMVFIPPMAFKNCLSEAAKFLGIQIPGKGKSTYTKHFEAGILIMEPLKLGIPGNSVPGEWLFVPSDGKRGGGQRVDKCFPIIQDWKGEVTVHILDETITKEVLQQHFEEAGKFIGVGRFRPRNNGFYGRFQVESLKLAA